MCSLMPLGHVVCPSLSTGQLWILLGQWFSILGEGVFRNLGEHSEKIGCAMKRTGGNANNFNSVQGCASEHAKVTPVLLLDMLCKKAATHSDIELSPLY